MDSIVFTHIDSPLGQLLLTSREQKLSGLYYAQQAHAKVQPDWVEQADLPIFAQTQAQIAEYAAGTRQAFDLPLLLKGTPFQTWVWNEIAVIPFGKTVTYGELARRIGRSFRDARAVGTATGQNPVSWVNPCHRVVGRDGSLTGYAGGLSRKSAMLEFEAARLTGASAVLDHSGQMQIAA